MSASSPHRTSSRTPTTDTWEQFFQVNVDVGGTPVPPLHARVHEGARLGRIQFLSSESALQIPSEMVHYGMTKSAVQSVSRGLAKVLSGTQVTVNAILPGPTRSEGVLEMLKKNAEEQGRTLEEVEADFVQQTRPTSILQRMASPEEVANMSVYAASEQASATTGAALRVEGGIVDTMA